MSELEYETLEIEWGLVEKPKYILGVGKSKFYARAVGKEGPYDAGESPLFLASDRQGTPPRTSYEGRNSWNESHKALDVLTDTLVKDGWEFVGIQESWFTKRFQRRVGKLESEPIKDDVISQLERLDALHKNGGLSDDEFQLAKKKLLGN